MRAGLHFNLFCSTIRFDRWYEILLRAMVKDNDSAHAIGKKKAVFKVENVPLDYNREMETWWASFSVAKDITDTIAKTL